MQKNKSIRVTITISPWVWERIIGLTDNKSARAEELIIKGFMAEKGVSFEKRQEINVVQGYRTPDHYDKFMLNGTEAL